MIKNVERVKSPLHMLKILRTSELRSTEKSAIT